MASDFAGSTVLITGGTGTFGSYMVRRLLGKDVAQIRVLSRDEAKQDDLRRRLHDPRARFYVGDVRDNSSVANAMQGVDYVFHAAALKQVPSCEFFPSQAILTNVTGSSNVIHSAADAGVKSVVCLSTDKAVYPVNSMGMTKALMEKTVYAFARNNPSTNTLVSVVRYGNILYSRGSVVPLFVEQLLAGLDLTVTDPRMTRFIMTLPESVELVEYAWRHGEGGDCFVKKAAASTIGDLALAVCRVFDAEPRIKLIGSRHGEKTYETLLTAEERSRADERGEYFRIPLDSRSLNYGLYFEGDGVQSPKRTEYNSENTEALDFEALTGVLMELPEIQQCLRDSRSR